MPALRAVLDTHVLLSGIAYPASVPGKLLAAWKHGALDVVLSPYILDELRRVLPKLAHRHGFAAGAKTSSTPFRSRPSSLTLKPSTNRSSPTRTIGRCLAP